MVDIFYHGSTKLFTKFNLDYALGGTGKVKFGFGVYLTSNFASAANYSKIKNGEIDEKHYVYTVKSISKNRLNYISFVERVHPLIVAKAEAILGESIPVVYTENGNFFRKYIGIRLTKDASVWKKLVMLTDLRNVRLKTDIIAEKAASEFLYQIGVKMIEWPFSWIVGEKRFNRAIFKAECLTILKIEEVKLNKNGKYIEGSNILVKDLSSNPHSLASFIKEYYPIYWGVKEYPITESVIIHKINEYWGIFSNYAHCPIKVNGVMFKTSEHLFQVLKFKDREHVLAVYNAPNPKMAAKKLEKLYRRSDWGMIFVDVMKFCLKMKYDQSLAFREKLNESRGRYIVEDQSSFKKSADAWGVKVEEREDGKPAQLFVGPNLLGRLLMELRDGINFEYRLPEDILSPLEYLK